MRFESKINVIYEYIKLFTNNFFPLIFFSLFIVEHTIEIFQRLMCSYQILSFMYSHKCHIRMLLFFFCRCSRAGNTSGSLWLLFSLYFITIIIIIYLKYKNEQHTKARIRFWCVIIIQMISWENGFQLVNIEPARVSRFGFHGMDSTE